MPSLKLGESGLLAAFFNRFLAERAFPAGSGDVFNAESHEGTKQLQRWLIDQDPASRAKVIQVDGIPGNQTFGYACAISDADRFDPPGIAAAAGVEYPVRLAALPPPPTLATQQAMFGILEFRHAPVASNKERIVITNGFAANIAPVSLPQLLGKVGAPASGKVQAHRLVAPQLQALWRAWDRQGLVGLITDFGGLWVPRLVRGSKTTLSNHAWGTAFDVNVSANWLTNLPAFPGENGSLFKHVPIAQDYGFRWGGHYKRRLDGMHFEAVKVLTSDELSAVNEKYQLS